jgi:hypothetical protein
MGRMRAAVLAECPQYEEKSKRTLILSCSDHSGTAEFNGRLSF